MKMMMLLAVADDAVRDSILKSLASYGGIAFLVVALVGGLKTLWRTWADGKEPQIAAIATLLLGTAAKICLPEVYGPHTLQAWTLHLIVLIFVAVGAKGVHDAVLPLFKKPGA